MDGGSVRGNGGSVYDQAVSDAEESGAPVNYLKFVAAGWAATVGGSIAYSYRTKPGLLLSQRMIHARLFAQASRPRPQPHEPPPHHPSHHTT